MNNEEFIIKANKKHNHKYDYSLINYIGSFEKVKIICKEHAIFEQTPANHLFGQRCPKCADIDRINKRLDSKEIFIDKACKIHNNKYNYSLVEYKKSRIKIKIICKKHGIFEQVPNSHLCGRGCPECAEIIRANKRRLTNEEFIKRANVVHKNKYIYNKSIYVNAHTPIEIECLKHGIFKQQPTNHIDNEQGCPICNESKGEKKINEILDNNNIKFEREKSFDGCRNKYPLRYDFYLPEYNLLIEYDGKQHFEPVSAFGGIKSFNEIIKNDNIKNHFARNNNIKLLRISYKEDIEDKIKILWN